VLYLRGCITPEVLPEMQRASLAVLRHNGCEVVTPRDQTCCGALHFHTGLRARGLELLAQNVRAFAAADFDAVIVDAAGCGSTLKEYAHLAAGTPAHAAAAQFAPRVRDIQEFLDQLGLVPPRHEVRVRVAYDEPCHLLHGQRVSAAPRAILRAIPGLEWVPLQDADRCCGSAGVYNIAQPELATAIREEKIRNIAASGAEVVATGNPGCILQIRAGLQHAARREPRLRGIRVVHPMQLLATSYGESSDLGA
jgi:glycolate oxidase iron-sulfur subunit